MSKLARLGVLSLWAALVAAKAQVNVTTYHNDNARDGQNLNETVLTPANVNPNYFGRLFAHPVDGYIHAQPLYVSNVVVGGAIHNVVYVATENDTVYAFDADNANGTNANPLWQVSFINPAAGITTVSSTDLNCYDIYPQVGITGTPVIDLTSNTLYVVAKTKENGAYFQRLHALDIGSGAEKFGGPVVIQATVAGTGDGSSGGQISFDPRLQNQRAGLMLANGLIYVSWAAHCDITPFHGWIMAFNPQTLQQTAIWNATPNGSDGGVWQSGAPPAADSSGTVFVGTGNGTFDLNVGGKDAGDSVLKFGPPSGGTLPILDYFTPYNQATLGATDADVGSGGVILFPDQPQGSPHQHLLVEIGKQGTLYLVNRDSMGHFNSGSDTQIVQWLPSLIGGLWGTPAFWNNTFYVGGAGDALEAFSFNANGQGLLSTAPVSASPTAFGYPGTTPSLSANGNTNGLVWALQSGPTAVLHAYDATNLAHELYNSSQNGQPSPGQPVKFAVPTVANGKVYIGTTTQLAVYGLTAGIFTSPAPGFELPSSTATFTWGAVAGATQYQLTLGTSPGASDVFSGFSATASQAVGFIPCTGGSIYVQLSAQISGNFQPVSNYTYACKTNIGDFNGDKLQDLVWQNNSTGQVNVNYFGGAGPQPQGSAVLNTGAGTAGWRVVGAADFDRNGIPDLVWQNTSTGQVNVNYYNAANIMTSVAVLNSGAGTAGWSVVAVADMNGDGVPDLIWQNSATGQVNVNYYGGTGGATLTGFAVLNSGAGTAGWKVVAAADFDGNGVPDLIWQNQTTNQTNVNYYGGTNRTTLIGFAVLNNGSGSAGWSVVAAADMNADGIPDLIWQNNSTLQVNVNYYGGGGGAMLKGYNCLNCGSSFVGSTLRAVANFSNSGEPSLVWQNNTTNAVTAYYYGLGGYLFQNWAMLNSGSGTAGWHVVGTGDFDGNGVPDLVWQNTSTGQVNVNYYGGAGGSTLTGFAVLNSGAGTSGWSVVAVADMNGDGVPDLIWQNASTGQVNVNYYGGSGGATLTGFAVLNSGAGTAGWKVVAAADFDGNGIPDLIWQNTSTRQVNVNYYGGANNTTLIGFAVLNTGSGAAGWSVVGAADFDGNGVPDLVWRNDSQGQVNVNYYGGSRGAVFKGWNVLNGAANPGWNVIVPRTR